MKRITTLLTALALILGLCACSSSATSAWQEQYDLGIRYLSEGNYREAIIAFNAAIEIDPRLADAYIGLADAYMAQGDAEQARQVLVNALAVVANPDMIQSRLDGLEESAIPEPAPGTSVTPTQEPDPTPEPSPTQELTTTMEPTPTPEASSEPNSTPEDTVTPTSTPEPVLEPTSTSTPTPTPTPMPTPTPLPTQTPTPTFTPTPLPTPIAGGDGSEQNPYQIATADQLDAVRNELSAHYILVSDIYLDDNIWDPIGTSNDPFTGSFDGSDYTIFHLISGYTSIYNYAGLFGYCANAYIFNVNLKDCVINLTLSDRGINAGGIVGFLDKGSKIEGCTYDGNIQISITGSYSSSIGGVVGWAEGEIISCTNYSDINVNGVDGFASHAGGIVGNTYATIKNCKNYGDVSTYDCAGGIVGEYGTGYGNKTTLRAINNCTNYGAISAKYAGGIAGKVSGVNVGICTNFGEIYSNYSGAWAAGIVAYATGESQIHLCVNTANVFSNANTSYNSFAAGIVAAARDTTAISQCYNTGEISSSTQHTGSWYDTTPSASAFSGGIVATVQVSATIKNCYNTGKIMARSSYGGYGGYYSSYGYANSGGIAGQNLGDVSNCYNLGPVYTYDADYCYEGAIIGSANDGMELRNCYYLDDINISAVGESQVTLSNVFGCTDSQLRQQSTYIGFDFSNIWYFDVQEGYMYPQLRG